MATNDWLTGIYLTTDEVLKYPDYVERLRDEIGLNTVVMNFSGELPERVLAKSPYGVACRQKQNLASLYSGILTGDLLIRENTIALKRCVVPVYLRLEMMRLFGRL